MVPGAGVGALRQLSVETKAALTRGSRGLATLEEVDSMVDQLIAAINSHRTSEAEGLKWFAEYLQLRTDVAAAHSQRTRL
jgi:hypothetical protein